jgi:hypothetical protein
VAGASKRPPLGSPVAVARTHRGGSWPNRDLWMFDDYVRGSGVSKDSAIASIGNGEEAPYMSALDGTAKVV